MIPNPIPSCRYCGAGMTCKGGRLFWCAADARHYFARLEGPVQRAEIGGIGVWIDEDDTLHPVQELPAWALPLPELQAQIERWQRRERVDWPSAA